MKKNTTQPNPRRKTSAAAKAVGEAILADLTEFANALESGLALDSKYTMRRMEIPRPGTAPKQYRSTHGGPRK